MRRSIRYSMILLTGALGAALGFAPFAGAQDQTPPNQPVASDTGTGLNEVVVTAERVETDVQKTPISMTVVNQSQLTAAGVTNLESLGQIAPDVHITTGAIGAATASIRGVASNGGAVTLDYDGQYVGSFNGQAYDIARVEVLKGPQGTLYGLNATAGTVNVITNAPAIGKFTADGSVEYGNYNAVRAQGAVNLPIAGVAAFRIAADVDNRHGYRDINGNSTTDYDNITSVRPSFLWKPIENFQARITAEYTHFNYGPTQIQAIIVTGLPKTQPPYGFNTAVLNSSSWNLYYPGNHHSDLVVARADLEYHFGWATLTYLPNYSSQTDIRFQNYFGTAVASIVGQATQRSNINQQEVRLNGATRFGLKWQVGWFYIDTVTPAFTNYYLPQLTVLSPPLTVPFLHFDDPDNTHVNDAIYSQVTQSLTNELSLTAGARYTQVHQQRFGYDVYTLNAGQYFGSGGHTLLYSYTPNFPGPFNYHKWSWHLGLDYQVTPQNLLYASV